MIIDDVHGMIKMTSRRTFSLLILWTVIFLSACAEEDPRVTALRSDMNKLSNEEAGGIAQLSAYIRECIRPGQIEQPDGSVQELGEVNIFSRENGSKLLLLVEYWDVKSITPETQPVLFEWVEACAEDAGAVDYEFYMAWTTGILTSFVKTPDTANANIIKDETALYPFYDGLFQE